MTSELELLVTREPRYNPELAFHILSILILLQTLVK